VTKERLKEYIALKREIAQFEIELAELLDASAVNRSVLTGLPNVGGLSDKTARFAMESVRLYAILNSKKLKAVNLCEEIENCIESLPALERTLMRERYILGKDWEEVCCSIGYSWRQTHRLHGKILKKINMA